MKRSNAHLNNIFFNHLRDKVIKIDGFNRVYFRIYIKMNESDNSQ